VLAAAGKRRNVDAGGKEVCIRQRAVSQVTNAKPEIRLEATSTKTYN